MEFCEYLDDRCTKASFKIGRIRYFGDACSVDERFCNLLNVPKENCKAYN